MTQGFDFYDFMNKLNTNIGSNPLQNTSVPAQQPKTLQQFVQESNIKNIVPKNVQKAMVTKQGLKNVAKYAPITGDIYDIARGGYQMTQGHPFAGAGQAGLGIAGLATLGGGSLLKSGAKAGMKKALEKGVIDRALYSELIKGANKQASKVNKLSNVLHNKYVAGAGMLLPEIAYGKDGLDNLNMQLPQSNQSLPPTEQVSGQPGFDIIDMSSAIGQGIPTPGSITPGVSKQIQNNPEILQQVPKGQANLSDDNIQAINNYIAQLQKVNQPYIQALQNYYNNYDYMLDQARRANRFWQGASGLTGNPAWAKIADYYNPLTTEANRLSIVKQIQDAQAGDLNAINELMGNMAIATNELELPPETAFANKNLLTALTANRRRLTDWEKAQLYDASKREIALQRFANNLQVQGLRNQGSLNNTMALLGLYGGGGYPSTAPGLNAQGSVQTYQPIQQVQQDPRAQFFK